MQNYCQNQQSRHLRRLCGSRCAETVPSFGESWMALLNFDLISLMTQATAIHQQLLM